MKDYLSISFKWSHGLTVMTLPCHGKNGSSTLPGTAMYARLAQLISAPPLQGGGPRFESLSEHH